MTRAISTSTDTGSRVFDGRVLSPPMSMMSAPSSASDSARRTAASTSSPTPSPENESGVTLRMPITSVRAPKSRRWPEISSGGGGVTRAMSTDLIAAADLSRPVAPSGELVGQRAGRRQRHEHDRSVTVAVGEHLATALGDEPFHDAGLILRQPLQRERLDGAALRQDASASPVGRRGAARRRAAHRRDPGNSGRTLYRAATRALAALMSAFAGGDVRRLQLAGLALRHHHAALEDADTLTALVERASLDGDDPAIRLGRRLRASRAPSSPRRSCRRETSGARA